VHAADIDDGAIAGSTLERFDASSGNRLESLIFNHRPWVLSCCLLLTALFGAQLRGLTVSASFEKTLAQSHVYIRNYLDNRSQLRGLGDSVLIVVESRSGDIFERGYLAALQEINDAVFLLPGVDRAWMKSLWTPVVRWSEVTEEGFVGGPVMPQAYDGSAESIEALRLNVMRAAVVGSLVANDFGSSAIVVPLLAQDGEGRALDYHTLASALEAIRQRHEPSGGDTEAGTTASAATGAAPVRVHVIGFAKLVGDLIDGLRKVMGFFAASAAIAAAILLGYTRCWRSTALVLACSLIAVVWQLGLVTMLGDALNPFSVLVPFLVFAIGVSHGSQKMNGIMQDIRRGASRQVAARHTFRRLFIAGLTALVADAVGFAVLMVIDIPVIRDLALSGASGWPC
jgi:predicted RND superfamily exporter protein